jgi:WD40 repeat protein
MTRTCCYGKQQLDEGEWSIARTDPSSGPRLWDTRTWQEMATLQGHSHSVQAVVFSRVGEAFASTRHDLILASASDDGTVRLWTAATEGQVGLQRNRAGR